ncbi:MULTISPECIES: hypothetical protein [Microbacterium]|uniref:hypothetical protein n=1 Tax=Microbacterium TaxID=33882 RepID=UPI0003DE00D8|nr:MULTISPECIES: hypothetical protein [Microbacterium]NKR13422.1 hypothetical protein [Arthrobacter sp. M5]NKR15233.1 hypothetical protein [Arthrobacter sp. M6]OEH61725.1 hypothetical protein A5N17_13020 [Arthrobacter sp. D2]CDJ99307.1 hypothetical protein MIC448_1310003 [Microbacterium sp. C448]
MQHPSPCSRGSTRDRARRRGEDPSILDAELLELREHEATGATLDLAGSWSYEAVAALEALPTVWWEWR